MRMSDWSSDVCSSDLGLISPKSNPWFEHARAAFFLAERDGRIVGRISAQVDDLVQVHMGHGTSQWGMFESEDAEVAAALIRAAEGWLRDQGMTRSLGPFRLSIWDEPGLLIEGHDQPTPVLLGQKLQAYTGGGGRRGQAQG